MNFLSLLLSKLLLNRLTMFCFCLSLSLSLSLSPSLFSLLCCYLSLLSCRFLFLLNKLSEPNNIALPLCFLFL